MEKFLVFTLLVLFINIDTFTTTLACPYCPYPYPSPAPPKIKPPSPPKVKPPSPPKVKPPLPPPKVKPPPKVEPPPSPPKVKPPPKVEPPPSPPKVKPPTPPKVKPPSPPKVSPPSPPKVNPPPEVPCPPAPSPKPKTCPIDILKLDSCVDLLGGLVHIGIGPSAESKCCPVLSGLADLDAALCLCTTIKAKVLNIKLILPIALQLLLDCGKHLPSDFQCPA